MWLDTRGRFQKCVSMLKTGVGIVMVMIDGENAGAFNVHLHDTRPRENSAGFTVKRLKRLKKEPDRAPENQREQFASLECIAY